VRLGIGSPRLEQQPATARLDACRHRLPPEQTLPVQRNARSALRRRRVRWKLDAAE
jgi:hypothetical protein